MVLTASLCLILRVYARSSVVLCSLVLSYSLFFSLYGDPRDLHVLTHAFPTRRSSVLGRRSPVCRAPISVARRPARSSREGPGQARDERAGRSEAHTSELQSLMRNSYAVFCLIKKK